MNQRLKEVRANDAFQAAMIEFETSPFDVKGKDFVQQTACIEELLANHTLNEEQLTKVVASLKDWFVYGKNVKTDLLESNWFAYRVCSIFCYLSTRGYFQNNFDFQSQYDLANLCVLIQNYLKPKMKDMQMSKECKTDDIFNSSFNFRQYNDLIILQMLSERIELLLKNIDIESLRSQNPDAIYPAIVEEQVMDSSQSKS